MTAYEIWERGAEKVYVLRVQGDKVVGVCPLDPNDLLPDPAVLPSLTFRHAPASWNIVRSGSAEGWTRVTESAAERVKRERRANSMAEARSYLRPVAIIALIGVALLAACQSGYSNGSRDGADWAQDYDNAIDLCLARGAYLPDCLVEGKEKAGERPKAWWGWE